jgi:hypothetical protein
MTALANSIPRDLCDPRNGDRRFVRVPGARIVRRECPQRLRALAPDCIEQFCDNSIAGVRSGMHTQ